jgi:hypothetical protein
VNNRFIGHWVRLDLAFPNRLEVVFLSALGFVWRIDAKGQRRPPLGSFGFAARVAAILDTVAVIGRLSRCNDFGGWKSGGTVGKLIKFMRS